MVKGGALGFKAFMSPSGIDDFPHVAPNDVAAALPTIRALGVPLLVHAELVDGDVPKGVSLLREGNMGRRATCHGTCGYRWCGGAALLDCCTLRRRRGLPKRQHCTPSPCLGPTTPSGPSPCVQGNPRKHATWLASRPRRFEQNAVRALLDALRATAGNATLPGFKLHIVHLAGAAASGAAWPCLAAVHRTLLPG